MKIRTDFVTNSSSSNFTVAVTIETKSTSVTIKEDPSIYNPDDGDIADFKGDLRDINSHLSSVEELATWLADSIRQSIYTTTETARFKRKKQQFIKDACECIKSVKDVDRIVVDREYDAWGEFADLVGDNCDLTEYAKKYLSSSGIEKERAEAEMVTYIKTATDARGETFGDHSVISRFKWNDDSVTALAKRLCSGYGPQSVSGTERRELNLRTGEYFDVSDFNLE